MKHENESLQDHKKRTKKGSQGKLAEQKVQALLNEMKNNFRSFDYQRNLDSRSAGRIVPAQTSDYILFFEGKAISLEVKSLNQGRLQRFRQLPLMLRRAEAGVKGFVLAWFRTENTWCVLDCATASVTTPSWLLETLPTFGTLEEAMQHILREGSK